MAKKSAKKKSVKKTTAKATAKRKPAMKAKPPKKAPAKKASAKKPSPKIIKAPALTFERIAARPASRVARAAVRLPVASPIGRRSIRAKASLARMLAPHDREE